MKQLTINSGTTEFILVEVPEGAEHLHLYKESMPVSSFIRYIYNNYNYEFRISMNHNYEHIGLFHKDRNEIDFEVNRKWVENGFAMEYFYFRNYEDVENKLRKSFDNPEASFLSLLNHETDKAFPLKENPYGEEYDFDDFEKFPLPIAFDEYEEVKAFHSREKQIIQAWNEAEGQICPKTFAVLIKIKP